MFKVIGLYLEVLFILGIPLVLMGENSSVLASRPFILLFGGIYCTLVLYHYKAHPSHIGLTRRNFRRALGYLITPSLSIIALTLAILCSVSDSTRAWLIGTDPLTTTSLWTRIALYMLASAPIQEFIFRGYFTYRMERILKNNYWTITLSVLVFTIAHVPFHSPIMLLVALTMGITYIFNYQEYRNLPAITISHAVVGAVLIMVRNFYLPY
jgi:hypothetical protein